MENPILKLEALYTILEKHLYDFDEENDTQKEFVSGIVQDYLKYLTTQKILVPKKWQSHVIEELHDQVEKMLIKKMYRCLNIDEFRRTLKKKKNSKYTPRRRSAG